MSRISRILDCRSQTLLAYDIMVDAHRFRVTVETVDEDASFDIQDIVCALRGAAGHTLAALGCDLPSDMRPATDKEAKEGQQ